MWVSLGIYVKFFFSSITIFNERGDHEFSNFVTLEQIPLHVRTDRDEVCRHKRSRAKAPSMFAMVFFDANLKVRSTGPSRYHLTT